MRPARLERRSHFGNRFTVCERSAPPPLRSESVFGFLRPLSLDEIDVDDIRLFGSLNDYPRHFETDLDILSWLCAMAYESSTARVLLEEAQDEGWTVRFDDLSQDAYAIDGDGNCLVLDHYGFKPSSLGKSAPFRHIVLFNFLKLLRELWHERHTGERYDDLKPEACLMMERVREADCLTMVVLSGWEMREAGHTEVWKHLLGSSESDMAACFQNALEKDEDGLEDGSVLARTFCEWYKDKDRVASTDHATLGRLDDLLEAARGVEVFGPGSLNSGMIERIATLPCDRSYLMGMGETVASDPFFAALHDQINEIHLFQIAYDSKIVMVEGVPFRDQKLASLIFPAAKTDA